MKYPELHLIKKTISSANNILLVTHKDPDFDALGSLLSFHFQLKALDIKHTCYVADEIPPYFSFLPDCDVLTRTLPDLLSFDVIIALDCSNKSRIRNHEALQFNHPITFINIDHHADNDHFGDINLVPIISSVGELLFTIYTDFGWDITQDIATLLYAAMVFDTGRFLYSNTTADTLLIASKLVSCGANISDISSRLFENLDSNAFDLMKEALANLVVETKLGFAYTCIKKDNPNVPLKMIDFIRQLSGPSIFIVFTDLNNGLVKVNFRSRGDVDVNKLAHKFNGGGHPKASGAAIEGNLADVTSTVVSYVRGQLNNA